MGAEVDQEEAEGVRQQREPHTSQLTFVSKRATGTLKRTYRSLFGVPQESQASQLDREYQKQEARPMDHPMSIDDCKFEWAIIRYCKFN